MSSKNTWNKESASYYIATVTVGDTELEVYGEVVGPEHDIGYTGDVELHDVRIAGPDGHLSTSVWEMVCCYPELLADIENKVCEVTL
jgi:hypothetical protein